MNRTQAKTKTHSDQIPVIYVAKEPWINPFIRVSWGSRSFNALEAPGFELGYKGEKQAHW